jgi:site-specific DNA recombinase
VTTWLNETGRRSRNDKLWSLQGVLHVLRNPVYLGKIAHGEDLHGGKHEAIVDNGLFARAQLMLEERAEVPAARPNSS